MFRWLFSLICYILETIFIMFGITRDKITNTLKIFVKTNTGTNVSVDLDPKWNIQQVKEVISPKLELESAQIRIIFAGKELHNSVVIEDCDLGPQSILHAVKVTTMNPDILTPEEHQPLCGTLPELPETKDQQQKNGGASKYQAHFYVFCSLPCKSMQKGKLRVRCSLCKSGAFTVSTDPCCWADVLQPNQVEGHCEIDHCDGNMAEFFFKCANHPSLGEDDAMVPLYLVRSNFKEVPCLSCMDVCSPVLVFQCESSHVICVECFILYCSSRLSERQFVWDSDVGYTLPCPAQCENSLIKEVHHYRLLGEDQYSRYQHFGTEEYILQSGGVLCPQPGCGMGIIPDTGCKRVTCQNGCGFVFCRNCLQGYHIGECEVQEDMEAAAGGGEAAYNISSVNAAQARWDEESRVTIKVITKPCPRCRTPTERDGGCMHMVCTRTNCGYHWCWVCQTEWTRECMGNHWFG